MIRKILLMLLIGSPCVASCSVEDVMNTFLPGGQNNGSYTVSAGTYQGIIWTDPVNTEPDEPTFDAAMSACIAASQLPAPPTPDQARISELESAVFSLTQQLQANTPPASITTSLPLAPVQPTLTATPPANP